MSYQPLKWELNELVPILKNDFIDTVSLFNSINLQEVERFTFDRAIMIINFLRSKGTTSPAILDLGASGGVFSFLLNIAMGAHVTALDDDRYISVQNENKESSIKNTAVRVKELEFKNFVTIDSSIEEFILNSPPFPLYDAVLFLNVLHHFYTGYGQGSDYGKMNDRDLKDMLFKLGRITNKFLFFEVNSYVINDYEKYLTDLKYTLCFREFELVGRSTATDGSTRAIWCFSK